jgi:type VI secretion system protein ImpE
VTAETLLQAGQLDEAIASLGAELRVKPDDAQRRTFLFELLCFAGAHERARQQLEVVAGASKEARMGALLYLAALNAERTRQEMFEQQTFPMGGPPLRPVTGSINGRAFRSLEDADPRIGPRLEVFAAGQYLWLPFAHIASVRMSAPRRLRDLLWIPAVVRPAPELEALELGEVLLPAIAPLSWQHPDGAVRLGRVTEWVADDDGRAVPLGQKVLLVDGEEMSLLDVRELDITANPAPLQ